MNNATTVLDDALARDYRVLTLRVRVRSFHSRSEMDKISSRGACRIHICWLSRFLIRFASGTVEDCFRSSPYSAVASRA